MGFTKSSIQVELIWATTPAVTHTIFQSVQFQELGGTHVPLSTIAITGYQLLGYTKQFIDDTGVGSSTFNDREVISLTVFLVFLTFNGVVAQIDY